MTTPDPAGPVTVPIEVPAAAVAPIASLVRRRYPDLADLDLSDVEVGRRGVSRMIRELLRTAEANRIEDALQAQMSVERSRQLARIDALLSQIN